ncbi:MAG: hypothetical protein ABTQ26_11435 [Azonexus sp.]
MENSQNRRGVENTAPAVSKIDRLQQKAQRLQQEAQQARERVREEAALQERLERLKARRKADLEVRRLGVAAWIAGLRELRCQSPDSVGDEVHTLDIDLLIGSMALLHEQMSSIENTPEIADLRVRGEAIRKDYFADKNNQKFSVIINGIPITNNEGEKHEFQ